MTPTASDPIPVPRIQLSPARQPPEGIVRPERYIPAMGEVRGTVELANARDIVLASRGYLPPEQVRRCSVAAVVDTSAVLSVLPANVVAILGLTTNRTSNAVFAHGESQTVPMTDPVLVNLLGREAYEETLVLDSEVLIGQTVLEKLDLWLDCAGQRLVPNPEHPDFSVLKVRRVGGET